MRARKPLIIKREFFKVVLTKLNSLVCLGALDRPAWANGLLHQDL